MTENQKSQEKTEKVAVAPKEEEITDAQGNEMLEKMLNAIKNMSTTEETPVIDKDKEYQDKIARQQADFDNYRKRMEKEKQENLINANANLISEILPVLDHFELALKHNKDKGVVMIYDELNEVLAKQGLKVVNSTGIFNPKIHEAVMKIEGEKDGMILEEIQKGYFLNDKLLRASKVKVSMSKDKK
jgi:molecular chaperone GrpE